MTDTRELRLPDERPWPAWALPVSAVAGVGALGAGLGLAVARYWGDPLPLAIAPVLLVMAAGCGAAVVRRALRHERRTYAVTEVAVVLAVAAVLYAGSPLGRAVLAALVGGGLLATAWAVRSERRQPTKMQNGWPSRSA
ncbi:hypothetical protein [Jiangella mangrovi]|uniref:Putative lysophospholipase L1 biosynthesis ABC-type transport system permease subunit n=1 Tax=Jiangella mangrovi TaxID=1524084 RepID=A0A7W9GM24_9ACTN|nr:hypothetical protein [Jiangella mangrovi]MBB5786363.1 putative lysophospholipase L1 biosynthesis ABC-type transport system permease subunit [Jiangella mangrovi]